MVGGTPSSHSGGECTPSIQSWWGVPHPFMVWGTPSSHGGTPSSHGEGSTPGTPQGQTWDGVPRPYRPGWGVYPRYPHHLDLGWGTPLSRPEMGYPLSRPGMGYYPVHTWDGVPSPIQTWDGVPPCLDLALGTPPQTWDRIPPTPQGVN